MTAISFVWILRSGDSTPRTIKMQLNRVRVFLFDPGRMSSNLVDSLRSGSPTPTAVRMQLNHILVLHCDPGKISSNGRLTEKQRSYPLCSQDATDPFCCVSFDPGRLEDHLTCLVFQIQPRWTTEPLIEHVTSSTIKDSEQRPITIRAYAHVVDGAPKTELSY